MRRAIAGRNGDAKINVARRKKQDELKFHRHSVSAYAFGTNADYGGTHALISSLDIIIR